MVSRRRPELLGTERALTFCVMMSASHWSVRVKRVLYTVIVGALFQLSVQATPLNLSLSNFPDIFSGAIDVTYTAATGSFSATGTALSFDDDGVGAAETIVAGGFALSATITNAGVLTGGTLTITGTVPTLGFNSGTLLTGTLTALGFSNTGGDPLEFLFTVTGGDAAGLYGGTGGIILSSTSFPATLFNQDFNNLIAGIPGTGSGVSDTAVPVPEPTSLILLAIGLASLGGISWLPKKLLSRFHSS